MSTAIDMFAGIGGNSQGAENAGMRVVWASNHSKIATDYYELNQGIRPIRQDLRQANFTLLPDHWLGMASPCCQGHTPARGKEKPHHDESRSTAWAVVDYLEAQRPHCFFIENVPDFQKWLLYGFWISCLQKLGYALTIITRDAADHGIPQHRERLFVVGVHGKTPLELKFDKQPHKPASSIIDLNAGRWSKIDRPGRAKPTLHRIKNGRKEFGDIFLTPYYSSGSGLTGRSINRPIGTITTVDRWAIIRGDEMRMVSVDEYRKAMSFGDDTKLPPVKKAAVYLLGNATCPVQIRDLVVAIKRAC